MAKLITIEQPLERESAVALGFFDGVHLGHRAVLRAAADCAAEKGLLSGLTELPWNTDESLPFASDWVVTDKTVKHVFTHFDLTLTIVRTRADAVPDSDGFFVPPSRFGDYPFSTLMKKVVAKAKKS